MFACTEEERGMMPPRGAEEYHNELQCYSVIIFFYLLLWVRSCIIKITFEQRQADYLLLC